MKGKARFTELHTTRERKGVNVKFIFSTGRVTQFKMRRYKSRFRKNYIVVRTGRKRASKGFRMFRKRRGEDGIIRE